MAKAKKEATKTYILRGNHKKAGVKEIFKRGSHIELTDTEAESKCFTNKVKRVIEGDKVLDNAEEKANKILSDANKKLADADKLVAEAEKKAAAILKAATETAKPAQAKEPEVTPDTPPETPQG